MNLNLTHKYCFVVGVVIDLITTVICEDSSIAIINYQQPHSLAHIPPLSQGPVS